MQKRGKTKGFEQLAKAVEVVLAVGEDKDEQRPMICWLARSASRAEA